MKVSTAPPSATSSGRSVNELGELIQQNLDEMARLESLNTGKTMFDSGKVEIPFAAEVFRYYAGWATKIHGETLALRDNAFTFTLRHPVGVVGAIVPWNFPFLLSSWKLAPALTTTPRSRPSGSTCREKSRVRGAHLGVSTRPAPVALNVPPSTTTEPLTTT